MSNKSPKQQLNVSLNPQQEQKEKGRNIKSNNPQHSSLIQQNTSELPFSSPPPKKREQLKKVQDDIEIMKNKILLLKIQLQKQQQSIKLNKNRTQDIIRKKITVNKVQKYKQKDHSFDIQRAQQLRKRNLSLRQSHQNEMQNILKAIYLVKLDDAREIKNLSKSHRKKIEEMNEISHNQQLEKKKKIAEQTFKAKQRVERYFKEKLSSIYQDQSKSREELDRIVKEKRDELKELREQEIKLLESVNKIQAKQVESKKEYLAAVSLPVKDVAQALNRSKSSQEASQLGQIPSVRINSQIDALKHSSLSSSQNIFTDINQSHKRVKVPNSNVNKQKLAIILKELKRLQKNEKFQKSNQLLTS